MSYETIGYFLLSILGAVCPGSAEMDAKAVYRARIGEQYPSEAEDA